MGTDTVDSDKKQGHEDLTSQFIDTPDIFQGLNEFFHESQLFN